MEKLEFRDIEIRLDGEEKDSGELLVSGYVNKTGEWSEPLGREKRFIERIMPDTFRNALQKGNEITFLAEHDNSKLLASTRNDSLKLREDDEGLFMEARISATSWGKDYHTLISDGLLTNMSFGMRVNEDKWNKGDDGTYERSITDIDLAEVSVVRNPAYTQSNIQARSLDSEELFLMQKNDDKKEQPNMSKEKQISELRQQLEALETEQRENEKDAVEVRDVKENDSEKEIRGVEQFLKGDMNSEEVRTLTTGSQSIAVPTVLSNQIVEKLVEQAAIFGRARNFQTVSGNLEILRETNIGDAAFVGENESLTANDFSFDKVQLEQRRAGTAIELTEQLINDSGINIINYATGVMTRRLARKLDEQALIGDKANKSFEGVLTVDRVANPEVTVGSHTAGNVTADNLLDMTLSMNPEYLADAVFVMSRATFNQVAKLVDADGRYLLVRDYVDGKPIYKIFGQQIVIQDKFPAAALAGDVTVLFCNFAEATASMTKKGASLKRVGDTTSALKGTQMLLLDIYADFKIINEDAIRVLELA